MNEEFIQMIKSEFSRVYELLEKIISEKNSDDSKPIAFLTVKQAADYICKAVPTVYGMVSRGELLSYKRGKRLYFDIAYLSEWIKAGRRQTTKEMLEEAAEQMRRNGRLNNKSNRHE